MEIINNNNEIDQFLIYAQSFFNQYFSAVKNNSQLSVEECNAIQTYYANLLGQIKNLLETLKAANISIQQMTFNSEQEKQTLNTLYNGIAMNDENNPMLATICNILNELNSLSNLPTTTINEIQRKYATMNTHFMRATYFLNMSNPAANNMQSQPTNPIKYKKPEKNS
ncbi:MAG: hypothetical protein IJR82_05085 [Bacilli bacterium]|nr:hypothetical protein [Bacilli bacterium]